MRSIGPGTHVDEALILAQSIANELREALANNRVIPAANLEVELEQLIAQINRLPLVTEAVAASPESRDQWAVPAGSGTVDVEDTYHNLRRLRKGSPFRDDLYDYPPSSLRSILVAGMRYYPHPFEFMVRESGYDARFGDLLEQFPENILLALAVGNAVDAPRYVGATPLEQLETLNRIREAGSTRLADLLALLERQRQRHFFLRSGTIVADTRAEAEDLLQKLLTLRGGSARPQPSPAAQYGQSASGPVAGPDPYHLSASELGILAEMFSDEEEARYVLEMSGYGRSRHPRFARADLFWNAVARELGSGIVSDGALKVLLTAYRQRPGNAGLQSVLRQRGAL